MPGASSSHKSSRERNKFFLKPENYSFFLQAYLKMLLLSVSMEEAWVNYGHFQECTLIQRCSASLFCWVPADKTALCNGWVSITSGRCRVRQKVLSSSNGVFKTWAAARNNQCMLLVVIFTLLFYFICLLIPPSKLHYLKTYLIKYLFKGYGNEHIIQFQSMSSINICQVVHCVFETLKDYFP